MKRFGRALVKGLLAMILLVVGFTGARASSFMVTTTGVKNLGTWITVGQCADTLTNAPSCGVGGFVKYFVAKSTDTLSIGDLVVIDTNNVVTKTATLASFNKVAGVVVGGRTVGMGGSIVAADVGSRAALPNRPVLICTLCRTWVALDTTTGGVTAGGLLGPSAIAGKVRPKTLVLDSLYRVIGRAVNGGAISTSILADVRVK